MQLAAYTCRALPAPPAAQNTGSRRGPGTRSLLFRTAAGSSSSSRSSGGNSSPGSGRRPSLEAGRSRSAAAAASSTSSPAFMGTSDCDLAEPTPGFDSIHAALGAVAAGELVVVLDDEDRENEGDLIAAADKITPAAMAFIVNHTSGVVCVGMEGADLDRLRIPLMVSSTENEEAMCTAFTVTVDLRHGTSTGISAADRAATLRALADPDVRPEDFKRPGHIFPLRARAVRGRGGGGGPA